jgi:hypothetical protein
MKNSAPPNDALTKDVLKLEELLRHQGPKTEYWEGIEIEGDLATDVDHELGWAEYGEFNLLYRRTQFDRDDEPLSEKVVRVVDAPSALRPQLHALLPLFMEAFAEHLENSPDDEDEESEDQDDDDGDN